MEVDILKDALGEKPVKKTDIASTLIRKGVYPMKRITDTLQVTRSNQYTRGREKRGKHKAHPDDAKYLPLIRQITDERPTYGYRRVTALLNRYLKANGQPSVNHKRIYRIMRVNHLLLPKHRGRPIRTHDGSVITLV